MPSVKAIGLLSFGIDSILAYNYSKKIGLNVLPVYIDIGFAKGDIDRSLYLYDQSQIFYDNLVIIDAFERFKHILKRPKYGFGKNLNPCIDCKILMFSIAKEIMIRNDFDMIITGEVKGQRLMSQINRNINIIEKEAKVEGIVLRPLSGKNFEPTFSEQKGIIKRDCLLDFRGKTRKPQYRLAKKLNIKDYPTPSGGCLLTYEGFSKKIRELYNFYEVEEISRIKIALQKIGRHFYIDNAVHMIIGRNETDNLLLQRIRGADYRIFPKSERGPYGIIYKKKTCISSLEKCKKILIEYMDLKENDEIILI